MDGGKKRKPILKEICSRTKRIRIFVQCVMDKVIGSMTTIFLQIVMIMKGTIYVVGDVKELDVITKIEMIIEISESNSINWGMP